MAKKLIPFAFLALVSTFPATQGCKSPEGGPADAVTSLAQAMEQFHAKLDSTLSENERAVLTQDGLALAQYQIDGSKSRWFAKIFGGNSAADVLGFLDERVKHIFPERTPIKLISFETTPAPAPAPGSALSPLPVPPLSPVQATMYATNYGPLLWFEQLRRPDLALYIQSNQKLARLSGTRVGVIKISPVYFDSATPKKDELGSSVFRTSILVHEARHSDCQGGLDAKDAAAIRASGMPLNQSCAHLHGTCPAQLDLPKNIVSLAHPMAGELMCDQGPWGAYAVQLVFTLALSKNCANCTELEKQEALMIASDSYLRVSKHAMSMLKGELGEPNMGSQGLHP